MFYQEYSVNASKKIAIPYVFVQLVASYVRNMEKSYMILGKREKHAENSWKYKVFLISDTFWQNERKMNENTKLF